MAPTIVPNDKVSNANGLRHNVGADGDRESASIETAARLISEAAHDLRSPLTTVKESIRLLCDGDLGELTQTQLMYLASALDQCQCMEQMVGDMLHLQRLRTGVPRVHREKVSVMDIQKVVNETLQPWAVPRQIDLLWDGMDDPTLRVFADREMLRRLVVNLVTNAIRASRVGSCVLIRLEPAAGDQAIRWSIIDQGKGIRRQEMELIAKQQVTFEGGEGLGLTICRQLAGLHFSSLLIRSREGAGTEVSFQTPLPRPRSVAECWARWRVGLRGPMRSPQSRRSAHRDAVDPAAKTIAESPRTARLDPPSLTVELTHQGSQPRCEDRVAAGVVTAGATMPVAAADEFDRLLQSQLHYFDLAYRVDPRRWVWVFDANDRSVQDRIDRISDAVELSQLEARLNWSEAQIIPLDRRRTHTRLSDLMVRESLSASTSHHVQDANEVRLGTGPIEPSDIAAERLDRELRHLTGCMRSQTDTLKGLAKQLRPTRGDDGSNDGERE